MPAKAKVTKEMIVDAAFAIAREASGTHQRKDCIGKAALLQRSPSCIILRRWKH